MKCAINREIDHLNEKIENLLAFQKRLANLSMTLIYDPGHQDPFHGTMANGYNLSRCGKTIACFSDNFAKAMEITEKIVRALEAEKE